MKVIWALYDDGNCSYKKAIEKCFDGKYQVYCIGINEPPFESNNIYIYKQIDLSIFNDKLIEQLSELPKPDFILASPPCESWSIADTIKTWYVDNDKMYITPKIDYDNTNNSLPPLCKRDFYKKQKTRLLGEATILATIKIIEYFKPTYWVIENPATSKSWLYQKNIINFYGEEEIAYYCAYDPNYSMKPTIFKSNLQLSLKKQHIDNDIKLGCGYDIRSKIPIELIKDIITQLENPKPQQMRLF